MYEWVKPMLFYILGDGYIGPLLGNIRSTIKMRVWSSTFLYHSFRGQPFLFCHEISLQLQYPPTRGAASLSRRIYSLTQSPTSPVWCVSKETDCPVCNAQSCCNWAGSLCHYLLDVSGGGHHLVGSQSVTPTSSSPVQSPDRNYEERVDNNIPPPHLSCEAFLL